MRHARRRIAVAATAPVLLLAACHRTAEDPGTATAEEQRQLNDAAATLDAANDTDANRTDDQP